MIKLIFSAMVLLTVGHSALAAPQCALVGKYENSSVSVFRTSDGLVTFKSNVDVNTDGALQSYKIDDLGFFLPNGKLQTNSALNTICNGVNIRRPNHTKLFGAAQCGSLIKEFKRIRDFGWLKNGENYVQFYAIARIPGTETAGESRGKPCEKDGFYVSQVARAMDASKPVCDPDHWVDALRIPAIVLPLDDKMEATGVALHDLAIVRLANGKRVGAIVGDTNPNKIGEATVVANMRLKDMVTPPANYRATIALVIPSAEYIVFPGTKGLVTNLTNASDADIQAKTSELFNKFGLGERPKLCQ
jgi:Fungal chitosanase of glycosyl hydrolase group 75